MEPNFRLQLASANKVVNQEQFQRLVRRFIYLAHTQSNIAFAVSAVSQLMHSPREEHFKGIDRILKYVKGKPGVDLPFENHGYSRIEAYIDADWARSMTDRRSTSSYYTFIRGNQVTWRSKKQIMVARSSAEAEFRAVAHGICELLWRKNLLEDLSL